MLKKKLCLVSPVHFYNDTRVFRKQALSLVSDFDQVVLYAKSSLGEGNKNFTCSNVSCKIVPHFKYRSLRFIYLIVLLFKIINEKADVYIFHNPDTLPLLFIMKLLKKKVVYDTHENFELRIMMREWIPYYLRSFVAKAVVRLESLAAKNADLMLVTQEALLKKYKNDNVLLIENAPVINQKVISYSIKNTDLFRLVYIGLLNESRGITTLISVLDKVNRFSACRLTIAGIGDEKYIKLLQSMPGWKYVDYVGWLEQDEAFRLVSQSDVGVITINDVGDHKLTSPNKLFEYMLQGKPFIASNFIYWQEKLQENECGIFVSPESELEIVNAIKHLMENPKLACEMGKNGYYFIKENFNWEVEYRKLKERLLDIM